MGRFWFALCLPMAYKADMGRPKLLLIIPAYNEEKRLGPTLQSYAEYGRKFYPDDIQILVVVNGSTDRTLDVVREAACQNQFIHWINIPERIGKGGALIEGLKQSAGFDLVGYVDADGATGPESFFRLVELCDDVDCVVGSRRVAGSVIHQYQPSHRQLASKVFNFLVQSLFRLNIRDTQCGAKVLRQSAVQKVLSCLHIADMSFDVNLLYALKRSGCSMLEAPVEWTDHLGSKVRYFRTSLVMFLSIVRLRLVYSPFYRWLEPMRPIEGWIYTTLRNPPPRRMNNDEH